MQSEGHQIPPQLLYIERFGKVGKPQLILLHGIATHGGIWRQTVDVLQEHYHIISIDLLGHGKSPKPHRVRYTAELQTACILHTLRHHKIDRPSTVIGFSIGALIAAKFAALNPKFVDDIILIAPPVYSTRENGARQLIDNAYHRSYSAIARLPEAQTIKVLGIIRKHAPALIGHNEFNATTWNPIMSSLRYTVCEQTIKSDIAAIHPKTRITILYGAFDHLVIAQRIRALAHNKNKVKLHKVRAPHGVTRNYTITLTNLLQPAV